MIAFLLNTFLIDFISMSIFKKFYGIILLTRPPNVLITFIAVFIGASVSGAIYPSERLFFACLSAGIICSGGNMLNDYFDVESDRINKPARPIPAGIILKPEALVWGVLISLTGFSLSFIIGLRGIFIAGTAVILLFLYNARLKKTILAGNIIISFLTGLAFIYGGEAVGNIKAAYIPAGFAFLFHFGREIIKDTEDIEGDTKAEICTFPVKFGIKKSVYLTAVVFGFLSILTFYPFLFMGYSIIYLLIVLFGVDFVLSFTIYSIFKNSKKQNLHRINNILKGDMLIGLLALYLK